MTYSYHSLLALLLALTLCRRLIHNYRTRQVRHGLLFEGILIHKNSRLIRTSPSGMDVGQRLEFRTIGPGA